MKGLALIAVAAAFAVAFLFNSNGPTELEDKYQLYLAKYQKSYTNGDEYQMRLKLFERSLKIIDEHNSRGESYTLGINKFADMTKEEYRRFLGYKPSGEKNYSKVHVSYDPTDIIDWRKNGKTNKVKDQMQCGSCWAFSATAAFEGAYAIKYNQLYSFSEQQLVDCSTSFGNEGCNGGEMGKSFQYLQQNAFCFESDYKYKGYDQKCKTCQGHAKALSYTNVEPKNSAALKAAIKIGPVSVAVEADNDVFMYYQNGIINSFECGTNLDHGIAAIGFDYFNKKDNTGHFIVRNSWGTDWGDSGHAYIAAGSDKNGGICGILLDSSYPEVTSV